MRFLVLVLVSCEGPADCWVSIPAYSCGGVSCTTCASAPDDGWVQCTDGFQVDWNVPTGGFVTTWDRTAEQAMDDVTEHCEDLPERGH